MIPRWSQHAEYVGETPTHTLSGCERLFHTEYVNKHNNICELIPLNILKKLNINTKNKQEPNADTDDNISNCNSLVKIATVS